MFHSNWNNVCETSYLFTFGLLITCVISVFKMSAPKKAKQSTLFKYGFKKEIVHRDQVIKVRVLYEEDGSDDYIMPEEINGIDIILCV